MLIDTAFVRILKKFCQFHNLVMIVVVISNLGSNCEVKVGLSNGYAIIFFDNLMITTLRYSILLLQIISSWLLPAQS